MDFTQPNSIDPPKSPHKTHQSLASAKSTALNECPSWSTRTPEKPSSNLPQRFKYQRCSQLPEKYGIFLRFFDALDASLKLLRLRKSIPVFTKIRAMIEKMSERRFTYQHLAQLKFLLPDEMRLKKVIIPDEETRCMKYDLHVSLHINMVANTKKRKRHCKDTGLKDRFSSRLLQFLRSHPEVTEIPEEELPEPFNRQEQDLPLITTKPSNSSSHVQKHSDVTDQSQPVRASHLSMSFKKHFSKDDSAISSNNNGQSSSNSLLLSSPSVTKVELQPPAVLQEAVPCNQSGVESKLKYKEDGKFCIAEIDEMKAMTPTKSAKIPSFMTNTPTLQTPKRCSKSPDDNLGSASYKTVDRRPCARSSCARSLQFDEPPRNVDIELQEDAECSNIFDIIPKDLFLSLKENEKRQIEQPNRKHMISRLPKLFDRIYYLFQKPKNSFIRKEAIIRDLTECHSDITDQSEVEEQLKLLQEIIPEWISYKLSTSGNILCSINKELNSNNLRLRLTKAM